MSYRQYASDCNCKYSSLDYDDGVFIKGHSIRRVTCRKCGHVGLWIEGGYEHWTTTPLKQWPRYFWLRRSKWLSVGWYGYVFSVTDNITDDYCLSLREWIWDIGILSGTRRFVQDWRNCISTALMVFRCRAKGHPYGVSVRASGPDGLEPLYYCSHCYEEV